MAQQLVNVGNIAGDGTGDELRDAFTKINQNFSELYSGNIQVTAANILLYSVAGRTGNVVLTVNDVAQAASKSYVNFSIASNIQIVESAINSTDANVAVQADKINELTANVELLTIFQANIPGNSNYSPANSANYIGTITTIQSALDELAARLKLLGG